MKFKKDLPESGPSNYVRLKDKESITGIFRGEVFDFYSVWESGKPRIVDESVFGARFRFKINFVVKEGASYVVKVFEQSKTVYEQLGALHDEYDLEKTLIKITRNGTGKSDTTYTLLPLRQEVPPETLKHIETLPMNPLGQGPNNASASHENEWPDAPMPDERDGFEPSDEIPF